MKVSHHSHKLWSHGCPLLQAGQEPTCLMRISHHSHKLRSHKCVLLQAGQEPTCLMDFWAQRCLAEVAEAADAGVPPPRPHQRPSHG